MEMNRDIAKISRIRGSNTYQQKWGTGRGGYQNKDRADRFQQGFQPVNQNFNSMDIGV